MSITQPIPEADFPRCVSWRWLSLGIVMLLIVALASASTSWMRVHPQWQLQTSQLSYFAIVSVSYCSWLGIAVLANWVRIRIPVFSSTNHRWLFIHSSVALCASLLHLLFDTWLLGLLFSFEFDFILAYIKKLTFWLPIEIVAYLACVMTFSLIDTAKSGQNTGASETTLSINQRNKTHRIASQDIEYVEAYDNYVFIYHRNRKLMHKQSLSRFAESLPENFCRVHRSYLVNLAALERLELESGGSMIGILKSGKRVPISRRRKTQVKSALLTLQ